MEQKIQFVNITEAEFFSDNNSPLFKVIPLKYALTTLCQKPHYLWFSNPTKWKDPFESQFLCADYLTPSMTLQKNPLLNRVYACCFSAVRVMEPQWFMYGKDGKDTDSVCATINKPVFVEQLTNLAKDGYEIYIGKVDYETTKTLAGSIKKIPLLNTPSAFLLNDRISQIRTLLLKRNAFMYENEIRVFIVVPEEKKELIGKDGFEFHYTCAATDMFSQLTLSPEFSNKKIEEALSAPLGQPIVTGCGFTPIANTKGATMPRVRNSRLYKSNIRKTIKL